jgi:hypothetical protein
MRKQKIGKIILAKVLEMPLKKYLSSIEKTTNGLTKSFLTHEFAKKRLFYAKVMTKDGALCFDVSDKRLESIYPIENCTENKEICSLKWINTRNRFSLHILKSLLDCQRKYWLSGKGVDLRPLTIKQFLSLYPLQYLDQSRFSRLITNLSVMNPQDQMANLKSLFILKKISCISH